MKQKVLTTLSMFFLLISVSNLLSGAKHALLIGVEDYRIAGFKSLNGPGNDLELMEKVLRERFQFQEKKITTLMDKQATHTKVKQALEVLAKRVKKGDFVYIHYSGHGAYVKDENGDEHPREFDQTWVTYGSRSKAFKGDDGYDVLDDELFEWLTPIFKKSTHVIFVSDSCHSASISKGDAPTARGVARDDRQYPFGRRVFRKPDFKNGIRIGAAEDVEYAYEYRHMNGKTYGVFTWFWAQALQQAQPGNTWFDIFKRTKAKVSGRFSSQVPQFQGDIARPVFRGKFKNVSPRIPVSKVMDNGKKIRIEKGSLSGVTVGSKYRKYEPREKDKSRLPTLEITLVKPFYSKATATRGTFKVSDLIIEEEHAYCFDPIPVFVNADDPEGEDKQVLDSLRNLFSKENPELQGFRLTKNQQDSEILLYVLRPKKKGNEFVKKSPAHTLPKSFPGQPPEVRVLNNCEKNLLFNDIHISFSDLSKGTKLIKENLRKITRLKEIKNLSSGTNIDIEFQTAAWKHVKSCSQNQDDCLYVPDINQYFKKQRIYGLKEIENHNRVLKDTLLTFSLKNNTTMDYYTYILDIMMDGNVKPVFPSLKDREQEALLPAGSLRDFRDKVRLLLDQPGREIIKLIITEEPIDISLLKQDEFRSRGGEGAEMNSLERLLTSAVHGTKGKVFMKNKTQWGVKQYTLTIQTRIEKKSPLEFSAEELEKELIARCAQIPGEEQFKFKDKKGTPERHAIMAQVKELYDTAPPANQALSHISTGDLTSTLMEQARVIKGISGKDDRLDFYELDGIKKLKEEINAIKKNTDCVAAIFRKNDLIDSGEGFSKLKVKNYGKTFNLCSDEPFRQQPIAAGRFCTGFLVKEDVIATAGHCVNEQNVTDLCFVFGFKMKDASTPVTQVPNKNIYKGLRIIGKADNRRTGSDWALIQLEKKVKGQSIVKLSGQAIYREQPVYIIGHPLGLPLKVAPGAHVCDIDKTCFVADLDVYSGNSGSPVFDSKTHEVIGIVVSGHSRDFRWTGNGWVSIRYPNFDIYSKGPQCTNVSEFREWCR